MKTTLFVKSNGLKGQKLFELVTLKLTTHRDNNLNEWNERVSIKDVELVIDGEEWSWEWNSKIQLTGMNRSW